MGYYVQTGTTHNKANEIALQYGGVIIPEPTDFSQVPKDKALICVVDNNIFEAAGYCYSPEEFEVFSDPEDFRPKQWLLMDLDKAQELTKFKESWDYKHMMKGEL